MNLRMSTLSVVLVGLLASACSGTDAKPKSLPSVASASPTATATASSVVVPASARPPTPQGAALFVRYFFEQLEVAYQQGRPFPVAALSDARCDSCRQFAKVADGLARDGYHFAGPSFTNLLTAAPPFGICQAG